MPGRDDTITLAGLPVASRIGRPAAFEISDDATELTITAALGRTIPADLRDGT